MNTEKIGKFIYECRVKKNMTQKELAFKLNVTGSAISRWERGIGCPDISLLSELSNVLDVSIDDLLVGKGNNKIGKKQSFFDFHSDLKKYIVAIVYFLLIISLFSIIIPCIVLARNFDIIIMFILLVFFSSMIIVKIYGNKNIEERVWYFWELLYLSILLLCFFLTRLFNYYVEPYWNNFYNIIPFKTISEYLHLYFINFQEFTFINYYLLNKIYLMIPFPILFWGRFNKKYRFIKIIILCFLFSLSREIYQYFTGNGVFDIDDIILNLIGCLTGGLICIIYGKINFKLKRREDL